jgi:hypothetical protein
METPNQNLPLKQPRPRGAKLGRTAQHQFLWRALSLFLLAACASYKAGGSSGHPASEGGEKALVPIRRLDFDARCSAGDGKVIGGSRDRKPILFNLDSHETILPLPPGADGGCVTSLSKDGKLAAGGCAVNAHAVDLIWENKRLVYTIPDAWTTGPTVSSDGTTVVGDQCVVLFGKEFAQYKRGLRIARPYRWRRNEGLTKLESNLPHASIHATACSADGSIVYGGIIDALGEFEDGIPRTDIDICKWDARGRLTLFPDELGKGRIVSCSRDGSVAIGLATWGQLIWLRNDVRTSSLERKTRRVFSVCLSEDGTTAVGTYDPPTDDPPVVDDSGVVLFDPTHPSGKVLKTTAWNFDEPRPYPRTMATLGISADCSTILAETSFDEGKTSVPVLYKLETPGSDHNEYFYKRWTPSYQH